MTGFLLDENLPRRLPITSSLPISHVLELGSRLTDSEIWSYARAHDVPVVIKDADFSERLAFLGPPARIVWRVFGNKRRREMDALLARAWPAVKRLITSQTLVLVHEGGLVTAAA